MPADLLSPDLPDWAEYAVALILVIGGLFALVGSWGLIRLPDAMTRLHAPTKATTVGIGAVLIASMLLTYVKEGRLSVHELLITLFLVLTAPITALFIAKVHLHLRQDRGALPAPKSGKGWAGYTADGPVRAARPTRTRSDTSD